MNQTETHFEGLPVTLLRRKGQRRLRLSIRQGVIIVSAPWWVGHREMLGFLESQRQWVLKTLARQKDRSAELLPPSGSPLPPVLYLGETLLLDVLPDPSIGEGMARITLVEDVLRIQATPSLIDSPEWIAQAQDFIQQWLKAKAKTFLHVRTSAIATQLGFPFNRLFIRGQTTKWGTCSTKRNISLNWKLIQCPAFVIDYLIVHELCHLREMNHGAAFWQLVASHCPDYKQAEAWLKRYGSVVFANY